MTCYCTLRSAGLIGLYALNRIVKERIERKKQEAGHYTERDSNGRFVDQGKRSRNPAKKEERKALRALHKLQLDAFNLMQTCNAEVLVLAYYNEKYITAASSSLKLLVRRTL
jgi:hypothetical protein